MIRNYRRNLISIIPSFPCDFDNLCIFRAFRSFILTVSLLKSSFSAFFIFIFIDCCNSSTARLHETASGSDSRYERHGNCVALNKFLILFSKLFITISSSCKASCKACPLIFYFNCHVYFVFFFKF